jgi:Amt family ammonium transporter
MFWGGGMLAHWGARDFAGGIVVHASAGWAALASVLYVGKRKFVDSPHNIPFIALGTGLLWFGWYGFNAGSELKVDDITATAFLNTDIAASFAAVTWLFVEWWYAKKPHFVGLLTGAVAGLATITPAAGYVPIYASVVIGIAAGVVCYYAIQLKNKLHLGRRARRVGRARDGRAARHRPPRRLRRDRDQPRRRPGPRSRLRRLFR